MDFLVLQKTRKAKILKLKEIAIFWHFWVRNTLTTWSCILFLYHHFKRLESAAERRLAVNTCSGRSNLGLNLRFGVDFLVLEKAKNSKILSEKIAIFDIFFCQNHFHNLIVHPLSLPSFYKTWNRSGKTTCSGRSNFGLNLRFGVEFLVLEKIKKSKIITEKILPFLKFLSQNPFQNLIVHPLFHVHINKEEQLTFYFQNFLLFKISVGNDSKNQRTYETQLLIKSRDLIYPFEISPFCHPNCWKLSSFSYIYRHLIVNVCTFMWIRVLEPSKEYWKKTTWLRE